MSVFEEWVIFWGEGGSYKRGAQDHLIAYIFIDTFRLDPLIAALLKPTLANRTQLGNRGLRTWGATPNISALIYVSFIKECHLCQLWALEVWELKYIQYFFFLILKSDLPLSWQCCQPIPQDLCCLTIGECDIVNSNGILLKCLGSGASGIELISGALIPGSTTAPNISDTYEFAGYKKILLSWMCCWITDSFYSIFSCSW